MKQDILICLTIVVCLGILSQCTQKMSGDTRAVATDCRQAGGTWSGGVAGGSCGK